MLSHHHFTSWPQILTCLTLLLLPISAIPPPQHGLDSSSIIRRDQSNQSDETLVPPSTWDTHAHVVDPANYPLDPSATYTTGEHTLHSMRLFDGSLGIGHTVLVQPSIYGTNNSLLLKSLQAFGTDYARAIVVYDPANTTACTLRSWHSLGVRGVRLNIVTAGTTLTQAQLNKTLTAYASSFAAAGLDWILEIYVPMSSITLLIDIIPSLGVRVVFDHFGHPELPSNGTVITDPYTLPGFSSLIHLINLGKTYVKLSAPYRLTSTWSELDPIGRELVRVAGRSRAVWASDWPHINGFEGTDIRPFVGQVLGWCGGDEGLERRVFVRNAMELFGIGSCSS